MTTHEAGKNGDLNKWYPMISLNKGMSHDKGYMNVPQYDLTE